MKGKLRAIVVLSFCIVVLAVGLIWLLPEQETAPQQTGTADVYEIVNLSLSSITAVKVENDKAAFAIMQSQGGVEMVSKTPGSYDVSQMRAVLYAAGHISGNRKLTDEASFQQYGLSQPRATITLYLTDNTQKRMMLLAENPLDGNDYFYSDDDRAIYLIAHDVADLFLRSEQDFLSHTVLSLKSRQDYQQVQQVAINYHGSGRDYIVEQTDQGFFLVSPVHMRLLQEQVNTNLLDPIVRLYADEVVATQAGLRDYGLDAPDLEVSLTTAAGTQRVILLREEDNSCLMADPDGTTIYRLSDEPLLFLMQDFTALLGDSIVGYAAGDLMDLTLNENGKSIFLEFSGSGTDLIIRRGRAQLSQEEQTAVMRAINQLTPVGELSYAPDGSPVFSMTAHLRSGTEEVVELVPVSKDLYGVAINGKASFVTDAQALQALQDIFKNLEE